MKQDREISEQIADGKTNEGDMKYINNKRKRTERYEPLLSHTVND